MADDDATETETESTETTETEPSEDDMYNRLLGDVEKIVTKVVDAKWPASQRSKSRADSGTPVKPPTMSAWTKKLLGG